jgi:hypothetical protein
VRLRIVYEPSEEGGFTAYIPALPGCISEGDTLDDPRRNILEAISLYLEPAGCRRWCGGRGNCRLILPIPHSLANRAMGNKYPRLEKPRNPNREIQKRGQRPKNAPAACFSA